MVLSTVLGFPRMGAQRELKKALESYWKGNSSLDDLLATGKEMRTRHWGLQKDAGLDEVPVGDFSFYDHVLDMCCLLGAVPERYEWNGENVDYDTYFAMARGNDKAPAMEMTKWLNTNYHYIVPEFWVGQKFKLSATKIFDEVQEALDAGLNPRPVLVGPVTFLKFGKSKNASLKLTSLLPEILPVYRQVLQKLKDMGVAKVQIDEPVLCTDIAREDHVLFAECYDQLYIEGQDIILTTYFETLGDNADMVFTLPVSGVHIDLVRGGRQLGNCIKKAKSTGKIISAGIVDGRNIWRNNIRSSVSTVKTIVDALGEENVIVASSCSLLHSPIDLDFEQKLDPEIKGWLSFAKQKLSEVKAIAEGISKGEDAIADVLAASDKAVESRKTSTLIHDQGVKERMKTLSADMFERRSPFSMRQTAQRAALNLPVFPTTTIGSFPQTQEIRKARLLFKKGELNAQEYEKQMNEEIQRVVKYQEDVDIDVLVHGEAERNDMVEYFGEQLKGFAFTENGWVQSYGSRCVKPPVIYGDVSRPEPMTVKWSSYAQSLTDRVMKGMLTGPITILFWSFIRDDQALSETCKQIGLAIRDEVTDLEKAGIRVIQIDEPAIREGLPLHRKDWNDYLRWAVDSFRLSSCSVQDTTQIHTHMCYSEFNDIIASIAELDADVISIETSRSDMELLDAFVDFEYPNEIGPGVYDIHSPRIPDTADMVDLLEKAEKVISRDLLWVNPDCGLKTRGWKEVEPALRNMVEAAKQMRSKAKAEAA